jgi:hypothetical protein
LAFIKVPNLALFVKHKIETEENKIFFSKIYWLYVCEELL